MLRLMPALAIVITILEFARAVAALPADAPIPAATQQETPSLLLQPAASQ